MTTAVKVWWKGMKGHIWVSIPNEDYHNSCLLCQVNFVKNFLGRIVFVECAGSKYLCKNLQCIIVFVELIFVLLCRRKYFYKEGVNVDIFHLNQL